MKTLGPAKAMGLFMAAGATFVAIVAFIHTVLRDPKSTGLDIKTGLWEITYRGHSALTTKKLREMSPDKREAALKMTYSPPSQERFVGHTDYFCLRSKGYYDASKAGKHGDLVSSTPLEAKFADTSSGGVRHWSIEALTTTLYRGVGYQMIPDGRVVQLDDQIGRWVAADCTKVFGPKLGKVEPY